jgi:hypothetical protein
MMKEAARTYETSVNLYQFTRRCKPEKSHLQRLLLLMQITVLNTLMSDAMKAFLMEDFFRITSFYKKAGAK